MNLEFAWHPEAWNLLAPLLVVCGSALVILVADLFLPRISWTAPALAGLVVALGITLGRWNGSMPEVEAALNGALRFDNWSVFLHSVILIATGLSILAADSYGKLAETRRAEFHVLILLACTGMMLIVASGDLITLFLGLELLSFPTYVLCGYLRHHIKSNESALKYFVMGSFASSIFLYGVALLWGATGSTSLVDLQVAPDDPLFVLGALLVVIGFLFKVGAVPFHMWVPDVYEGAPTPITMFMATAIKVAAFGAFSRVLVTGLLRDSVPFAAVLWWIACVTMIVGNMSALTQDNIKRMLAFSSVAHAGYMLLGLVAVATLVAQDVDPEKATAPAAAILYYLLAYTFMNIGAFTVVTLLSRHAEGGLLFDRDWSGIARRHPFLGMAMAVFMVGLGGLPPTAGFFGKYSLFRSAIDAGLVSLVIIAVLNSLVSVYYYLRVIVAMYMKPERKPSEILLEGRTFAFEGPGAMAAEGSEDAARSTLPPRLAERGGWAARIVVILCLLATLWLGMGTSAGSLPGLARVMDWAESAVTTLR